MTKQKLAAILQTLEMKNERCETVRLTVGELLADEETIRHEWAQLTQATPFASAKLQIRVIPAEQQCMWCFLVYHPRQGETKCPQCRSVGAKIIHGEEFYLDE